MWEKRKTIKNSYYVHWLCIKFIIQITHLYSRSRKLDFHIVRFLFIASILQSFGRYPRSALAASVGRVAASTAQRGTRGTRGPPMLWLRRGARVSRRTIRAHLVITKGAGYPRGELFAKFSKMRYPWWRSSEERDARAPKRYKTSSKCRAWTPLLFFNFFPFSVSEWVKHAGGICSSLDRKRDMSYTEPLWEINGNQAPVSPARIRFTVSLIY